MSQVFGKDFQCSNLEKDFLSDPKSKLYLMHSFSIISNYSFDQYRKSVFQLPLTYPSKHLVKLMEYMDNLSYSAIIDDSKYNINVNFKAMRIDVTNEIRDYCGFKQKVTYFVLVMKPNYPENEKNSIILYGCDVLTSEHVTVLIIENDNFSLTTATIDEFLQYHKVSMFSLSNYANQGFCMCSLSRQYVADCIGEDVINRRTFNINLFWIVIGIITIFIIILVCF